MNNYEKALSYYQSAYEVELKMSSPYVLYIEKYKDNIYRTNSKLLNFTFKKFMQVLCTIYEHFK
jgi:hypothetical protein